MNKRYCTSKIKALEANVSAACSIVCSTTAFLDEKNI